MQVVLLERKARESGVRRWQSFQPRDQLQQMVLVVVTAQMQGAVAVVTVDVVDVVVMPTHGAIRINSLEAKVELHSQLMFRSSTSSWVVAVAARIRTISREQTAVPVVGSCS
jgi:hypothetical protein